MGRSNEFDSQIRLAASAPSGQGAQRLEQLYRQAVEQGRGQILVDAIARALASSRQNLLLETWGYRLGILPLEMPAQESARSSTTTRTWATAIAIGAALGLIWALLSAGKPPVPSPFVAAALFWLGWAPVAALGILFFLTTTGGDGEQRRIIGTGAAVIILLSLLSGWPVWARKDAAATLTAFHLPLLVWFGVGAAATQMRDGLPSQRVGFIMKSAETLLVAGIFSGGAGIFGVLTLGIFQVLGVHFPESWISRCSAFGLGLIPLLAVASTYDPGMTPARQDFSTGPARLMRLLTRLLLAPVLAVLAVYVLWFIPHYFQRAFEERSVLIVYNATLAAVLLLIILAVPHVTEDLSAFWLKSLRQAIRAISTLALILNLYSLAAVVSRTHYYGLSPNRHAVVGWNVVTLLVFGSVVFSQFRCDARDWTEEIRRAFARFLPLAAFWTLWVLLVSPWI